MPYKIPDWGVFQNYKDRRPPWIRLHRTLLENRKFQSLPLSARAMLPMMWLLATETEDYMSGIIDLPDEDICFRLRITQAELEKNIQSLVSSCFIEVVRFDTGMYENVSQRQNTESETKTDNRPSVEMFESFWNSWKPYEMVRGDKRKAGESYGKACAIVNEKELLQAAKSYCETCARLKVKTKHVVTWLNQRGWENEEQEKQPEGITLETYENAKKMLAHPNMSVEAKESAKAIIEKYEARNGSA